jgi:TrkA-N domain
MNKGHSPSERLGSTRVAGLHGRRIRLARNVLLLFFFLCLGLWGVVHFLEPCVDDEICKTNAADAYLVVQMLFANGNDERTNGPILQWLRLFVPWTLPLLGVYSVVSSLRVRFIFFWRALFCRKRDLVIVIGLGQKGMEMVRAELGRSSVGGDGHTRRRTSVVVIEPDEGNPRVVQAETEGAEVWIGDGRSLVDLSTAAWKRPSRIWIMTGDSRRNLLILELVRKKFDKKSAQRIDVYAAVSEFQERRDAMRLQALNQDREDCWTHIFNQEEALAEWLIRQSPVRSVDGQPPRVLIVGLGPLGRSILRELLLICHFPDSKELQPEKMPQIVMVDRAEVFEVLDAELPFQRPSNLIAGVCPFVQQDRLHEDAQGWVFEHYRERVRKDKSFTHVFICMGSEVRNLALAERILGWELLLKSKVPRIVPVVYDDEAADWSDLGAGAASARLIHPFNVSSVYTLEALSWRNEVLVEMAKRINYVYNLTGDPLYAAPPSDLWKEKVQQCAKVGGEWHHGLAAEALKTTEHDAIEARRKAAADVAWQRLAEDDRRSSLSQARYLFNRFHTGGADEHKKRKNQWNCTLPDKSHEAVSCLDLESRCEHRRWSAFMLVENFGRVPLITPMEEFEQWEKTCDEKIPGNDGPKLRKFARVNLNLIPYDELPDKFQRIDSHIVAAHEWIKKGEEALS